MTIKREDLLAAATAGVLHYGEIDSLLIFLAQREATVKKQNEKQNAPTEKPEGWKRAHWLCYMSGILAISCAILFGVLFPSREVDEFGWTAMLWFALVYALCAVGATAWFDLRGRRVPIGLFVMLTIVMIPLTMFVLWRMM